MCPLSAVVGPEHVGSSVSKASVGVVGTGVGLVIGGARGDNSPGREVALAEAADRVRCLAR